MDERLISELIEKAFEVRENSYSPYSGYRVGAALLGEDGRIFTGTNVENASYPAGLCAERSALARAVSDGAGKLRAVAVVGGNGNERAEVSGWCYPCGICRQALSELCAPDFIVISARSQKDYRIFTLSELLPLSFGADSLNGNSMNDLT